MDRPAGGDGAAKGEGAPPPDKSEEYLLEAAGSVVGGLGVDFEGDEVSERHACALGMRACGVVSARLLSLVCLVCTSGMFSSRDRCWGVKRVI